MFKPTKYFLYHGTNKNVTDGELEPRNPTINWNFSDSVKQKVQPSISFYDNKKSAKNGNANVYKIKDNFNLLSLIDENLSDNAEKYIKINNKELKRMDIVRSIKDWATSKKAYKLLVKDGYEGIIVWDAGNVGEDIEFRIFNKVAVDKV
ncbi:MAG: hypothetical protein Q7K35_05675 [bacterium]|nr:hypothetical protein [bacterium]